MINRVLAATALGLALGAILVMFTPWMRDFSRWNIDTGGLMAGTTIVFTLCFLVVAPTRDALVVAGASIAIGAAVSVYVLSLPAMLDLVPNTITFINNAQYITAFSCVTASPFVAVGGVLGAFARAALRRRWR
ncbi:MAG: hypothetical protein HZB53_00935 [Chloroflexi bacterium]|nr:hypothetical protein [Chloroflexota bacterium]